MSDRVDTQEEAEQNAEEVDEQSEPSYGRGYRWEGDDAEELRGALEAAFDYRGNVTLFLRDGGEVVGYLFNRSADAAEPFVDMFPASGGQRRILYSEIRGIAFTGKDTAAGTSWEKWVEKYNAKKAAEARGETVGSIDRVPEELD